jgi:hypothetical protein
MSSSENRQQTIPAIPPSLSAGVHGMRDYYLNNNAPRPTPNQSHGLTPYLGLRAKLSQIWINRWTVLLLLVLVRVLLAIASTDSGLSSARREALSACTSVEKVGSTMASMPHYMSQGVNKMTAKGISKGVNALESMVTLSVTGVEEIIVFYIGMLTNTYLCLTTFAVTGSTRAAIDTLQTAQDDLNKMLGTIGNDINGAAGDLQKGINGLISGINTFTGAQAPKVDFSKQITALKNVKLPVDITADLQKLNSSLPTFEQVKNDTETAIRFPFEELKKVINESMGRYEFNESLFPVPQKEALQFCSGNNGINDFFDNLVHIENVARKAFIGTLLTAAILICIPMAWWEIQRYRKLQERAKYISSASDSMEAVYLASRPYTSRAGQQLASRFPTNRRQILVRWSVAYATSVPALFVLSLALAGLFACTMQYILLKSIEKQVPGLTNQVANFSGNVVMKLNNASTQWADGTNQVILAENQKLNTELLGWVNTSTEAVNNTLNKFVDETMNILNQTFGGTPLYDPVKEVFNCLIGIKVEGVQKGLTWVHDNAKISFPTLDKDTFSLGALAKSTDSNADDQLLADPSGKTADEISEAVFRVTNAIAKGIRQEAIISTMILVVWLIIVLIGIIAACVRMAGKDKVRAEAGDEYNAPFTTAPATVETRDIRPESAAPPSYAVNPDVNPHAPYTLNPHPFPRRNDDEITEKRAATPESWPFDRNLTSQQQEQQQGPSSRYYNNEKDGFI